MEGTGVEVMERVLLVVVPLLPAVKIAISEAIADIPPSLGP
jgi:hypothetical protein